MVKASSRVTDGLKSGVVIYNDGVFKVLYNEVNYKVDSGNILDVNYLYSLPFNDKREHWAKKKHTITSDKKLHIIRLYWSTIRDKQKVRGIIKDDTFIIKNYGK